MAETGASGHSLFEEEVKKHHNRSLISILFVKQTTFLIMSLNVDFLKFLSHF